MRFQLFHKIPQFDLDQLDPRRKWHEMDVLLSRRYLNNHNWVEYWDNVQQTWQLGFRCFVWKSWGRLSGTRFVYTDPINHTR